MMFLMDLIKANNHKLVKFDECELNHTYESVFAYSARHGGTFDGYKFYNDFVVDVGQGRNQKAVER